MIEKKSLRPGGPVARTRRGRFALLSAVAAAGALFCLTLASSAYAVDEHLFDPTLSLTGSTATSPLDEVADPGPNHPPGSFDDPCGVATDRRGYIYVASAAGGITHTGIGGRIDVFDPSGHYLTEMKDEYEPCEIAVDSKGNVYVHEQARGPIMAFEPNTYPPTSATIFSSTQLADGNAFTGGVAVDPSNDHLYIATGGGSPSIAEYDSLDDGSALLDKTIGTGQSSITNFHRVDVWGANHDVYVDGTVPGSPGTSIVGIFDGSDGHLKLVIDGSDEDALTTDRTPENGFAFENGYGAIAVDQANGDVYVGDTEIHKVVHQFGDDGHYIGTISHSFKDAAISSDIAVDDPIVANEPGYSSPNPGYVFVTSGTATSNSNLYAFSPKVGGPPIVSEEVATQITDTEAVLRARVNPQAFVTNYRFEYTDEDDFEENEFANATVAPVQGGELKVGGAPVPVVISIDGLSPATAYRFRVVASNECTPGDECTTSGDAASFATYSTSLPGLPDGRAYELVTPPDTGGRIPTAAPLGSLGMAFPTLLASPSGESVVFSVEGGSLPNLEGTGLYDLYESVRDSQGDWRTSFAGIPAGQAAKPYPGAVSADHGYSVWVIEGDQGTLATGEEVYYLRGPGGTVEPVGRGSLGDDLRAQAKWISADGEHVIFATGLGPSVTAIQLEPNAPPDGVRAVYDRTPGGATHVVSLLPGDVTPTTEANYRGASADGTAVVFVVGGTMYERLDNAETVEVEGGSPTFAGISENGGRVFYVKGGDIFSFDSETGEATEVGSGGESTVVNVSSDGSHVYFVSPRQLDGSKGELGRDNLYAWDGLTIRFIATLDHLDVTGDEHGRGDGGSIGGLGQWVSDAVSSSQNRFTGPADDPSRSTPDGETFVFESHADLVPPYEGRGHTEIYRYDASAGMLSCVSCMPTGAPARSDASLESPAPPLLASIPPLSATSQIANVTSDGESVYFQSNEPLAMGDIDNKTDVYEWKAEGAGSCHQIGGCVSLISSGRSDGADYLYAMTADGHDVYFWSGDQLVPQDPDGTPSIYDARVGGGSSVGASSPDPCLGEACQPAAIAPDDLTPASLRFEGAGNVREGARACPKRTVRRHGKCIKKHTKRHHQKHHRRAANHNRGDAK